MYFGDGRFLLWSDIPNNRVMKWEEETGTVSIFRKPSNNTNGNTRDQQGRLVSCEHDARRAARDVDAGGLDERPGQHHARGLDPHAVAVDAVAERVGWDKPAPQGIFRGICQHMGYGSYVAAVAEVAVKDNKVKMHRIVAATNCGHAVNDFRKLCGIESYAPTDNVSELTARTNDEGWSTVFSEWLKVSRANEKDAVFVFSVGGGNLERNVSPNLVEAVKEAKARKLKVFGVVGRDGGYTREVGDVVVVVPTVAESRVTPHSEAFQAVVWHCLVSHPKLQVMATKW